MAVSAEFENAVSILARLRASVGRALGCEQTLNTMNRYTLAETCKVVWQQAKTLEDPKP
ncbi:MAG TPA: hypothetical protein VGK21_06875 [Candidatus Angelobacter sp.]